MEIRIVASVQAKPEYLDEVIAAARRVVAPSRQEAGNLQYDLHEEIGKPGSLVFFERWKDEEAIKTHENTEHFQLLVKQLAGKTGPMDIKLLKVSV